MQKVAEKVVNSDSAGRVIMSHFNGLEALKAVLIIGTDYRKIDNTLYRYCTGRVTRICIPTPVIRSQLTQ